jgi:3-phosphoshikimate 1-carboxyvinyltransferase
MPRGTLEVHGRVRVPGDKSISHRALMFAALAQGASRISGILESADVHSTAGVLRAFGVDVPELGESIVVHGRGVRALSAPGGSLDCGNSGTTTRLVAGIAAALPFRSVFTGDSSLSRRPMARIARPLEAMGGRVELAPHGGLPMTIQGGGLHSVEWRSEVASAQVKSAVLLAGVAADVPVTVIEPAATRDHTERMLAARGVTVEVQGTRVSLAASGPLRALDVAVPGDPSSAAFLVGLATLAHAGEVSIEHVCVNETRVGFMRAIARMGGHVAFANERQDGGEPVADIVARPARLRGIELGADEVPSMIDELPLLACIAARATGDTVITGAAELRVKESDRIAAVVANLRALGVAAEELPDGMRVSGSDAPLRGSVRTHGDHRLAMAFGVLAALPESEIDMDDRGCVAVSYPGFWRDLERVCTW